MVPLMVSFCIAALQGNALLVSTDNLGGLPNVLIVDARPLDAYVAGHIPGAAHVDFSSLSETRGGVVGLLRPLREVHKALGQAGVDPAKHVVVYSAMDEADEFKDAARLFWILEYVGYKRVSILDGGYAKWKAEGRPTEKGPAQTEPITMPKLTARPERLATLKEVQAAIKEGNADIADLRSAEYFRGDKKADIVKKPGHIPTANSMPAEAFLNGADRTVKDRADLEALAGSNGVTPDAPVITYCNTGRSASVGYFIMRLMGHEDVSLYDGSMAEWTARGKKTEADTNGKQP